MRPERLCLLDRLDGLVYRARPFELQRDRRQDIAPVPHGFARAAAMRMIAIGRHVHVSSGPRHTNRFSFASAANATSSSPEHRPRHGAQRIQPNAPHARMSAPRRLWLLGSLPGSSTHLPQQSHSKLRLPRTSFPIWRSLIRPRTRSRPTNTRKARPRIHPARPDTPACAQPHHAKRAAGTSGEHSHPLSDARPDVC